MKHGTSSGYQAERRAGRQPCPSCTGGNRWGSMLYRQKTSRKCAKGLGWPEASPDLVRILERQPS